MFRTVNVVRFFVEGGGGRLWTDLGGRVPEQSSKFNFVLMTGGGLSWFVSSKLAISAGYRFYHISNAGLRIVASTITTLSWACPISIPRSVRSYVLMKQIY